MKPYIPVWRRPPNKFHSFETRRFDDGVGHAGTERVALFYDKHGKLQEMIAQVVWDNVSV